MPILTWSQSLDTGVNSMNDQHKKLLDLMNKLYDRNEAHAAKPEIVKLVNDLANYAVQHFKEEEAYMQSISFPDLEKHKFIHSDLIKKVVDYKTKVENGDGKVPADFFFFLKGWLTAHIQGIDMKYGQHAASLKKGA